MYLMPNCFSLLTNEFERQDKNSSLLKLIEKSEQKPSADRDQGAVRWANAMLRLGDWEFLGNARVLSLGFVPGREGGHCPARCQSANAAGEIAKLCVHCTHTSLVKFMNS